MPVSCHFRDCKSAAGRESDSCKRRYNKCPDLYLYLSNINNKVMLLFSKYLSRLLYYSATLPPPHRRPYYNHSVFLSVCVSVPAAINSGTKRNAQLNSMRMWPVSQVTNLTDLSWKGQKHNGTMPRKRDTENTRQFLNERPLAETHTVHKRSTF